MAEKGSKTILNSGFKESTKNILKTIKLTENTDILKVMAIHWREASDGQEHWLNLMHWGGLKSYQTCKQANMLAMFPLTTARDRHWWSHCCYLGSPEMSTSFFARKGAVTCRIHQWFQLQLINASSNSEKYCTFFQLWLKFKKWLQTCLA